VGLEPASGTELVINLRAETADVTNNRCLVPASELELFTGSEHPKRRWRVTLRGEPVFFFGSLWREATADAPASYAVLTIDAAPDIQPFADRQPVIIKSRDVPLWLSGQNAAPLLEALPAGSYEVRPEPGARE
jgi:putative SOS response-associated peptidase YedK